MRKFSRKRGQRKAFIKGLANNLILKGKIQTTAARAKEIRPVVERLVSIAKKQQLSSLRLLLSRIPKDAAQKLFYEIVPKYKDRNGGFLRITKTAKTRKRDGVAVSVIEFV